MSFSSIESDDYVPAQEQIFNGRYTVLNQIGSGAFSTVWRCVDEETGYHVALKIQKTSLECELAAKAEAKLLAGINHPNVICLLDKFIYYNPLSTSRKHYCLVYELCECNLYELMDSCDFGQVDREFTILIIRQILNGLVELHSRQIIHTDLKPENILLKGTTAKIADFSTADWQYCCDPAIVGTRHYRAPEVILGLNLTTTCDIWAVGCILFELLTGDILFYPHNYGSWNISRDEDHLAMMVELLGPISNWMLNGRRSHKFFKKNGQFKNLRHLLMWPIDKVMYEKYKINDPSLIDLLAKMLTIDPQQRLTAAECLQHPWLTE
jgi:serine/threonine protein kinase